MIPDETADKPTFSIGLKKEGSAPETGFFKKEYKDFINTGGYIERKLRDEECNAVMDDYTGMEVRSFNTYKIGESTRYKDKSMLICAKKAETEGAQIVFTYVLGSEQLYSPEKVYNNRLHGRCLEGKVVKCENERIKIQLDIDKDSGNTKPEGELYWFNWQPETGNLMYCMPEKDTVVSLYIGGKDEGDAIVINSLRKNKDKDTDDPEKRYLTSIHKKRMLIKKKEIGFSMEDKDEGKTHFILNDDHGITFRTEKGVKIQADGELKIIANAVTLEAAKRAEFLNKKANVVVEKTINAEGRNVYLGFGAASEAKEKADIMKTSKIKRPQLYESELERMSQEIMEGYFRKDEGKLSMEDRESLAKTLIQVHEMTEVAARKNSLPPENAKVINEEQAIYYDKRSRRYAVNYAWEKDDTVPSTRKMTVLKEGEYFDRVGPEGGRCVGKVDSEGNCAKLEERSIPYYFSGSDVEKESSYHRYKARKDFTRENLEMAINASSYSDKKKA